MCSHITKLCLVTLITALILRQKTTSKKHQHYKTVEQLNSLYLCRCTEYTYAKSYIEITSNNVQYKVKCVQKRLNSSFYVITW